VAERTRSKTPAKTKKPSADKRKPGNEMLGFLI
jgi:hypothetical protein